MRGGVCRYLRIGTGLSFAYTAADMDDIYDMIVIGGGIVGLATAKRILERRSIRLAVLEREADIAQHQTGHNSGVIHSGLYYRPGSLKAHNCVQGRDALYRYCAEKDLPHDRCGKIVAACSEEEVQRLHELEQRGQANGLKGLRRLSREETLNIEPHLNCLEGLLVPETGIVDFTAVCRAYRDDILDMGGEVHTSAPCTGVTKQSDGLRVTTAKGDMFTKGLVNCAGLQSDRIARLCGLTPEIQIIPFRGEYYKLKAPRSSLVSNLIYPVPDPRFPFLGVHFTRMVDGGVEAGPNAVLALKREGYTWLDISFKDLVEMTRFSGFWRMAGRYGMTGLGECCRSFSKKAFVHALQRLVPDIRPEDVMRHGSGVRAQAVNRAGRLLDDFCIMQDERSLHVLNAPSPAATASLSIGDTLATQALEQFNLS